MSMKSLDKAIKACDAEVLKNASGTVLGKVITKSGNKYVIEDTYGTKYLVVENDVKRTLDKAIKCMDEERKIGEFGGIKYEITENSDGSFNIKLNGQPHKNHARFSSLREAEKNVQMNIGEILSYERATGKKALIRNFA